MPFVTMQNGQLYFTDWTPPQPRVPPLLLIHGAGGSRLDWPPSLRRLPIARVLTIDLPGHGKSSGMGYTTTEAYAQVIAALCDALNITPAIFVGHSMGGAIAQQMALHHPNDTAGLILIATGSKLPVAPDLPQRIRTDRDATLDWVVAWAWHPTTADDTKKRSKERMSQVAPEVLRNDYLACQAFDTRERLHQIGVPTLVIGSKGDRMVRFDFSVTLAEGNPSATLAWCEDAGHMVPLEQPAFVTETITNWLVEQSWPLI